MVLVREPMTIKDASFYMKERTLIPLNTKAASLPLIWATCGSVLTCLNWKAESSWLSVRRESRKVNSDFRIYSKADTLHVNGDVS